MAADNDHKALLEKIRSLEKEAASRKKAEGQLKKQSAFLNSVLVSLSHPFYVVDANDYSIKLANSAALKAKASGTSTCHTLIHNKETPFAIPRQRKCWATLQTSPSDNPLAYYCCKDFVKPIDTVWPKLWPAVIPT